MNGMELVSRRTISTAFYRLWSDDPPVAVPDGEIADVVRAVRGPNGRSDDWPASRPVYIWRRSAKGDYVRFSGPVGWVTACPVSDVPA